MIEYIDLELALRACDQEQFVVGDMGLLSAAVLRPQTSVFGADAYPDLQSKAAVLIDSISTTQPLVDGNKRLSLLLADAFLGLNGWALDLSDDEAYEVIMWQAQTPHPTWPELADRLRIVPMDPPPVARVSAPR